VRPPRDYTCKDCRQEHDTYIVFDSVWKAARLFPREFCCRACLEKRIARRLTNDDYTFCPANFDTVEGFDTEENYRKLYAQGGLDYDKCKAEYLQRCANLGVEPRWDVSTPMTDY
jgi:hypothetical protein